MATTEAMALAATATPDAMRTLIGICNDPTEEARARIVAACAILDRGMGRVGIGLPPVVADPGPDISHLTDDQRAELMAAMKVIRRVAYNEHEIEG